MEKYINRPHVILHFFENFSMVIVKAKEACKNVGQDVLDHFPDVRKMVCLGSGSEREVDDVMLTRYSCYLMLNFCLI